MRKKSKKKSLQQAALIVVAIGVYFFSSPYRPDFLKSSEQKTTKVAVQTQTVSADTDTEFTTPIEVEIIDAPAPNTDEAVQPPAILPPEMFEYIEIFDSCNVNFVGECVNARSEPSATSTSVGKIRTGVILRVESKVIVNETIWYKINFNEPLHYPERLTSSWYVSSEYARPFFDEGLKQMVAGEKYITDKQIIVDLTKQTIYAYEGDALFMEQIVSTGVYNTPTPRGTFSVFKKIPSRYMQGPIPGVGSTYYDLPGVPWNLYFTSDGAVFHGAYWHEDFGHVHSNGCVNMPLDKAGILYAWADLGTKVIVRD